MGYGSPAAGHAATMAAPAAAMNNPGIGGAAGMLQCPRCGSMTPGSFAYCQQCGLHLQAVAPTDPLNSVRAGSIGLPPPPGLPPAGPYSTAGAAIDPKASTLAVPGDRAAARPASWGTAVLVNRDGSDGDRFALQGEYAEIGRAGADIAFEQDRFLARSHARLERVTEGVRVVCLDLLNGVFRKVEFPVELEDGSVLLVGREMLRFERVDADESAAEPLVRHGVALFGSPPRAPWGRLSELLPSGGIRDIRHLNNEEIVIGREEGDLVYRDDAFMSRRHAAITWDGQRVRLTDLGSSNGSFLRIAGSALLRHQEHLRMGDQLFRIELR